MKKPRMPRTCFFHVCDIIHIEAEATAKGMERAYTEREREGVRDRDTQQMLL